MIGGIGLDRGSPALETRGIAGPGESPAPGPDLTAGPKLVIF